MSLQVVGNRTTRECLYCGEVREHYVRRYKKTGRIVVGRRCVECSKKKARNAYARRPERSIWKNMRARCSDPKHAAYANYGGRGITVCQRWESFDSFLADMGPRPEGMTIERLDPDKDYSPENCIWASRKVQSRNRRDNRRITFGGRTLCLVEWSEETGIPAKTIRRRLKDGWTLERALTTSSSAYHKR